MSWTRVLLDSSTRTQEASRPVGAWVVERSTVDRYLRLLLSERPLRSFDVLQEEGSASMLVEVFSDPASMRSERSGTPLTDTSWDWTLEQAGVLLPVGLPGVADEDVSVRVQGAGTGEPPALELAATSIEPYLDGREALLAAHLSR
ncbi:hypothetical protein [Pseudokineococcus sp. 1T1Z-3]|uniref:hypothetical protein n=1 Tax=Pseudokineococcus sp. 1T1Z-3 TaxID=3132745 RepID=UPI0030A6EAD7